MASQNTQTSEEKQFYTRGRVEEIKKKKKITVMGPLIKTWIFIFFNPSVKSASVHSTIKENNASFHSQNSEG